MWLGTIQGPHSFRKRGNLLQLTFKYFPISAILFSCSGCDTRPAMFANGVHFPRQWARSYGLLWFELLPGAMQVWQAQGPQLWPFIPREVLRSSTSQTVPTSCVLPAIHFFKGKLNSCPPLWIGKISFGQWTTITMSACACNPSDLI